MRFWVAKDTNGQITLFTKEPKRYKLNDSIYSWAIEGTDASAIQLINHFTAKRYIDENGNVEYVFLADMIGLKREGYKDGVLLYEGISMLKAKEIDIEFKYEFIKPKF